MDATQNKPCKGCSQGPFQMSLTVRHGLMLGTWWKISAREFSTVRQETLAAKVA